jgi:hypothetical protein
VTGGGEPLARLTAFTSSRTQTSALHPTSMSFLPTKCSIGGSNSDAPTKTLRFSIQANNAVNSIQKQRWSRSRKFPRSVRIPAQTITYHKIQVTFSGT